MSDKVGDMYRFDCLAASTSAPCPMILSANGTILGLYVSNSERLEETWTIPVGAKWLYVARNIGTGDNFKNNRFWHQSVGSRIAEAQKAETITEAFERLAVKIPQSVTWGQGVLTPEGSSQYLSSTACKSAEPTPLR